MTAALLAPAPVVLDAAAARALTDRLWLTLNTAHELLIDAYTGRAHEALGYGAGAKGWRAYCAAEFGEMLSVRLPSRDALEAMVAAGLSQRNIAAPFGVSAATVNAALADRPEPAPATPPTPLAARIVTLLEQSPGLDVFTIAKKLKVRQSQASPALSRLAAAGRISYTRPARRGFTGTYGV